ncbi:MAG: hypothetical protein U0559_17560 [Anaerolineae bacterium]
MQAAVGLIMPIGVGVPYPILSGTRISVYDAIYEYGLNDEDRKALIDRVLVKIRQLSPLVMLSLRNTFRKRAWPLRLSRRRWRARCLWRRSAHARR